MDDSLTKKLSALRKNNRQSFVFKQETRFGQIRPKQGAPRLTRQHVAHAKQEAHGARGLVSAHAGDTRFRKQ